MLKIGIIGSRSRNSQEDKKIVYDLIKDKIETVGHYNLHIISGGCPEGADGFAEQAADYFGLPITIFYPKKNPRATSKQEATQRFHYRNLLIANECHELYALVADDRTGGTENTIGYAEKENKKVILL